MSEPLIGLVMIVKNESQQLERCLRSVRPFIDFWTICDTGSSDDTPKRVRAELEGIPGVLRRHKWRDFGHNLTLAHRSAQGRSRWLLWMHADMSVQREEGLTLDESGAMFLKWLRRQRTKLDALGVQVNDGARSYHLPLLMRGDIEWRYVGATHEYLDRVDGKPVMQQPVYGFKVFHHADGSSRPDKMERDLELLKPAVLAGDPRATFYTAETYRYAGRVQEAVHFYGMRTMLNGYEEERWYSRYQIAVLTQNVEALFEVWRERPWRHEPLTAAAKIIAELFPDARGDALFLERPPV